MSRAQSTSTYDTATDASKEQQTQAKASYGKAQADVDAYRDQVSKFSAANPFSEGGAYQTGVNQVTSNAADAVARSYGNMLQQQAGRTGENRTSSNASAEAIAAQAQRDLASQQGEAVADRVGKDAAYRGTVLQAGTVPIQAETQLSGQQGGLAANNLGTAAQTAAANKSFWDQFGGSFASTLGSVVAGGNGR